MKAPIWGLLVLMFFGPPPGQAQKVAIDAAVRMSDKPYIQVAGQATVSARPDQAAVEIGVVTQGPTAVAVAASNATQTNTVVAELRKIVGGHGQLSTASYTVRPNYAVPKSGGAQTIIGFTATNVVDVTLDDLSLVSKVIDSATQSGANTIQSLQYRIKDPRKLRAQALRQAAENARGSAEAIAAGLGMKIVRVLSAEEPMALEEGLVSYKKVPPAPGAAPPTPLEIGTVDVEAGVILRVEVAQ
jgi:uncharacterized protein